MVAFLVVGGLMGCGGGGGEPSGPTLVSCGEAGQAYTDLTFPTTPAGCQRLLGSLDLSESAVDEFTTLATLQEVDGFVRVENAGGVARFDGLQGLARVGEDLTLVGTSATSFDGLGVQHVDGDVRIESNLVLVALALEDLETVAGDLRITGHPQLISLATLTSLQRVEGDLHLYDNPSLPEADIEAFLARVEVGGSVLRVRPSGL